MGSRRDTAIGSRSSPRRCGGTDECWAPRARPAGPLRYRPARYGALPRPPGTAPRDRPDRGGTRAGGRRRQHAAAIARGVPARAAARPRRRAARRGHLPRRLPRPAGAWRARRRGTVRPRPRPDLHEPPVPACRAVPHAGDGGRRRGRVRRAAPARGVPRVAEAVEPARAISADRRVVLHDTAALHRPERGRGHRQRDVCLVPLGEGDAPDILSRLRPVRDGREPEVKGDSMVAQIREVEDLESVQRLSRDLARATATLNPDEARYLVDTYYSLQEYRIAAASQIRALREADHPHVVLSWLYEQMQTLEDQTKRALAKWAESRTDTRWAMSITGIG